MTEDRAASDACFGNSSSTSCTVYIVALLCAPTVLFAPFRQDVPQLIHFQRLEIQLRVVVLLFISKVTVLSSRR